MKTIRLGVVGLGRIGRIHALNLAYRIPGAQLAAAADPVATDPGQLPLARIEPDPRTLLEDPSLDAIVIASPTSTHADLLIQGAAAGKALFCEKPVSLDLPTVDRAIAAVDQAGVPLQIGFNRRFDPGFARAKETIASGAIGAPHLVRLTSRDPQPPSAEYRAVSGGLFRDMTIHDFDAVRWLLGEEAVEIFAVGAALVDPAIAPDDVDTALLSLRFGSGALASIDNSRRAVYGYDVRVEVFGSDGAVCVGNVPPTTVTRLGAHGIASDGPLHWFVERFEAAYLAEMAEFVACVREGLAPSVSGRDGRMPLVMAEAALESMRTGRPVSPRYDSPAATRAGMR